MCRPVSPRETIGARPQHGQRGRQAVGRDETGRGDELPGDEDDQRQHRAGGEAAPRTGPRGGGGRRRERLAADGAGSRTRALDGAGWVVSAMLTRASSAAVAKSACTIEASASFTGVGAAGDVTRVGGEHGRDRLEHRRAGPRPAPRRRRGLERSVITVLATSGPMPAISASSAAVSEVLERPGARLLVGVDDHLGDIGVLSMNLGGVEEAVGVEVDVAVGERCTGLDPPRAMTVEPRPGVDAAALEGGAAVGVLQGLQLDVPDGQPCPSASAWTRKKYGRKPGSRRTGLPARSAGLARCRCPRRRRARTTWAGSRCR